jgi:KipI family sensor histidine kinase inhibitor
MFPTFSPCGDSALLITFGSTIDLATNRRAHALARLLQTGTFAGILEAVPGYATLLVHYDPLALDYDTVLAQVRKQIEGTLQDDDEILPAPRRVEVPVIYGGEGGPDLEFVARHNGLTPEEVVRRHCARDYPVYLIGFTPGFPYLGGLDERIAAPRLLSPRQVVPAGSVGIAGQQTGIYSVDSPGGWQLIGWTPLKLFDPQRQPASLLAPGDVVRFVDQEAR